MKDLSLKILKSMLNLLNEMENDEEFLGKWDQYNIIVTIKNILKGDEENKQYFLDNGGTKKFIDLILSSDDMQLMEVCIQAISEQASDKKVMISMIAMEDRYEQEEGECGPLKQIIR